MLKSFSSQLNDWEEKEWEEDGIFLLSMKESWHYLKKKRDMRGICLKDRWLKNQTLNHGEPQIL